MECHKGQFWDLFLFHCMCMSCHLTFKMQKWFYLQITLMYLLYEGVSKSFETSSLDRQSMAVHE